jgi:cytochrome c oxidase assembly factor 6
MGILSFLGLSSSAAAQDESAQRATAVRTGAVAPTRQERALCWAARDAYFACLDSANIVDPLADEKAARRACGSEDVVFERDCAAQWVRLNPSLSRPLSLFPGSEGIP